MRLVVVLMFSVALTAADYAQVFNVKMFGAAGDRKSLDTSAIQKTIDACNKSGGGVVYFPTGDYLSGTLTLKSGVTLHLSPGATLWGSREIGHYNPRGNHFFAYSIKDKMRRWLNPAPIPYRKVGADSPDFRGYLGIER